MRKKGFTLIELLAVIVILAIIALIATPIVLNIIKDTKEKSKKISAENYLSAVEQAIVKRNIKEEFKPTICTVISQGLDCEGYDEPLKVEIDGEVPTSGTIYFSNSIVANGTLLNFDGYIKKINNLDKENVKAVTEATKTTGLIPIQEENGNIKPGSEFKIKVNDTSGWLTFFVLSNDGDYVNLIAERNISPDGEFVNKQQKGDEWYVSVQDNRYGPQTAYTYLSTATSNWANIPIIESFDYIDEGHKENPTYGYQSIEIELDEQIGKYKTKIISQTATSVIYENMRARLPKYSEVTATEVGCTSIYGSCRLWMVNYLYSDRTSEQYYNESNKKIKSEDYNYGYWLLSSSPVYSDSACSVYYYGSIVNGSYSYSGVSGIRPVITILKSDLLRVMEK